MPRFKLTIEYTGTRYSGWQIQKNARTVAGEIDRSVRTVTNRRDFELYGAGRTDAGVHATGQVAHLDVVTSLPPESLRRRINDELPADIHILSVDQVPHRFHARHDAVGRRYLYQIARRRTAFAKAYVWWVKDPIDVGQMKQAARSFVGMRDFQSFSQADDDPPPDGRPQRPGAGRSSGPPEAGRSSGPPGTGRSSGPPGAGRSSGPSTLVLVDRLDIVETGGLVLVGIEGSHFLWKMVRRIVGVLVEIGAGRLDPSAAAEFLAETSEAPARLTAPPSGLFLERVYYRGDARATELRPITPLS